MSKGIAHIDFPRGNITLSSWDHVVGADVPLLLYLDNMDKMEFFYANHTDNLEHPASGQSEDIVDQFGYIFVICNAPMKRFFSEIELKQLSRPFGHSITGTRHNLL